MPVWQLVVAGAGLLVENMGSPELTFHAVPAASRNHQDHAYRAASERAATAAAKSPEAADAAAAAAALFELEAERRAVNERWGKTRHKHDRKKHSKPNEPPPPPPPPRGSTKRT